ncbi:MAG: hypothetical protein K0S04_345 [Herbinix sp.]|jgi:hypothetical protein|nr:hypothetical protein [Herbinix sp.]
MHFVHNYCNLSPLCQVYKIYQTGYNKGVLERQLVLLDVIDIRRTDGNPVLLHGVFYIRRLVMNTPIHVRAAFSVAGEIRPQYVQLDGTAYKIHEIEYSKEEIYVGISTVLFCCYIERNGQPED